jgi:hypothetical protein
MIPAGHSLHGSEEGDCVELISFISSSPFI